MSAADMRRAGLAIVPFVAAVAFAQEAPKPAAAPPEAAKPASLLLPEMVGTDGIRKPDGLVVRYYRVNYVSATILAAELAQWKSPRGKIDAQGPMYPSVPVGPNVGVNKPAMTAVPDVLRIEEVEENWPVLRRVLDLVDVPQLEVYVEAKIVEILVTDDLHYGVEAHIKRPLADTFFQGVDLKFPNAIDATNQFTTVFRDAGKYFAFDYVVDLVNRGAKTKVVSKPGIFASQGETATIRVGDDEPIVQQQLSGNTVTATTIFKDTGLRLEVQPLLVGRDGVRARISAEASRVSEFRVTATSNDLQVVNPVISKRNADTVVTVLDGETLVIGGLDQTSDTESRTGIPLLMDIPWVGVLFGSTTKTKGKTELIFFLTFKVQTPHEARIVVPPGAKERTGE